MKEPNVKYTWSYYPYSLVWITQETSTNSWSPEGVLFFILFFLDNPSPTASSFVHGLITLRTTGSYKTAISENENVANQN